MRKLLLKLPLFFIALLLLILPSCSSDNPPIHQRGVHIISSGEDIMIDDYSLFNAGAMITLKDNKKKLFLSNGTYIIFVDECPICKTKYGGNTDG